MSKITFGTVEEKRERSRVYRMERLRKLYNDWQDQVELWDTPIIRLEEHKDNGRYLRLEYTPKGNSYFYDLFYEGEKAR